MRRLLPLLALASLLLAGCQSRLASVAPAPLTLEALSGTAVTENNLGVDWFLYQRNAGTVAFVPGPATPPLDGGSLQMSTPAGSDKVTLLTNRHAGTPLSAIDGIAYRTYRDGSSTQPGHIAPAINLAIDFNGATEGGFTILVWEPLYAYGNGAIQPNVWQTWDTFAPTQTSFAGGWWSTRDIPGVCAFGCFVDWSTIIANNPDAVIGDNPVAGTFGVNVGSGPAGSFLGNVDALSITVDGATTLYNFEPFGDLDKDTCKNGGWQAFTSPTFRNQGDCVSWFASGGRTHGGP